MGDVLSTQAELEGSNAVRRREKRHVQTNAEDKVADMVNLYVEKGVSREDSETVMRLLSKYDRAFLELVERESGAKWDRTSERAPRLRASV